MCFEQLYVLVELSYAYLFEPDAILKWGSFTDDNWYSYIVPRDWEILVMEALLHVPGNEEKQQTLRISLLENVSSPACTACTECKPQPQPQPQPSPSPQQSENQEKK